MKVSTFSNQNMPLLINLNFEQLVMLILQLSEEQQEELTKILTYHKQAETNPLGQLRGKLDITQFRTKKGKTWESIEGKWPGNETEEEINHALNEMS